MLIVNFSGMPNEIKKKVLIRERQEGQCQRGRCEDGDRGQRGEKCEDTTQLAL